MVLMAPGDPTHHSAHPGVERVSPDQPSVARRGIATWRVAVASLSGTFGFVLGLAVAVVVWVLGSDSRRPGCEIPAGTCTDIAPTAFGVSAFLLIAPWVVVVLAVGGSRVWVWPALVLLVLAGARLYVAWLAGANFFTLAWLTDPLF